jgi:group II intron reverse transcriptase/maturase
MNMIGQIITRANLNAAYLQVVRNKGAAGVDGLRVDELQAHLQANGATYVQQLREGRYQVAPICGMEIPKSNGKKRLLGIPTVVDRVFQQAVARVLQPVFEAGFQAHSYGFRPGRNAHQAVGQSLLNINEGYQDIVDIDLKSFFDKVEHYLLLELIYKRVKCPMALKLIRSFLRAPILIDGQLRKRRKGVPQGSPLSPLLSNILLNELDKELEKRGHRYVRYADDFSIYVRSKAAAKRVGNSIYCFLRDRLKLPINREKSGIRRPTAFALLGYGFVPTYRKGERGRYQLIVETSRWKSLKAKLKAITRKTTPASLDERLERIGQTMRGWINYFKLASIHQKIKTLDHWLRNRLRYCIWSRFIGRRNPIRRGEALSDWASKQEWLTLGAAPAWVAGEWRKVPFCARLLHWKD